jgi:2-amino-4-hydroxy-6-hydroxymethyldihydropteridine diphosphokinase
LAYIGIGSNLGDKRRNCCRAIRAVAALEKVCLKRCSPFYATEPVGEKDQDWFVNAVMAVETSLGSRELLRALLAIEGELGRERKRRWGPRVIDLDLLFYGAEVREEASLQLPHPRLHERRFVLLPLREIAPDLIHPLLGKTVRQMLAELGEGERVLPLPKADQRECTEFFST